MNATFYSQKSSSSLRELSQTSPRRIAPFNSISKRYTRNSNKPMHLHPNQRPESFDLSLQAVRLEIGEQPGKKTNL